MERNTRSSSKLQTARLDVLASMSTNAQPDVIALPVNRSITSVTQAGNGIGQEEANEVPVMATESPPRHTQAGMRSTSSKRSSTSSSALKSTNTVEETAAQNTAEASSKSMRQSKARSKKSVEITKVALAPAPIKAKTTHKRRTKQEMAEFRAAEKKRKDEEQTRKIALAAAAAEAEKAAEEEKRKADQAREENLKLLRKLTKTMDKERLKRAA